MTISTPVVSQIALLLSDIRDLFGVKIEMSSADLVAGLIALDGRPWIEGKPMTQNMLARMLKPLGIGPDMTGPENARQRGYRLTQFREAFERYLPPEEARTSVQNAANTGNGSERGLPSRRVQELVDWFSGRAFMATRRSRPALDAELRAILCKEMSPEQVEIEFERIMKYR